MIKSFFLIFKVQGVLSVFKVLFFFKRNLMVQSDMRVLKVQVGLRVLKGQSFLKLI